MILDNQSSTKSYLDKLNFKKTLDLKPPTPSNIMASLIKGNLSARNPIQMHQNSLIAACAENMSTEQINAERLPRKDASARLLLRTSGCDSSLPATEQKANYP